MIIMKESTKPILLDLKEQLVNYYDVQTDDKDSVEYLINLIDLILQGRMELDEQTYKIIRDEFLVTGTEHKSNRFMRIIMTYGRLGKEILL